MKRVVFGICAVVLAIIVGVGAIWIQHRNRYDIVLSSLPEHPDLSAFPSILHQRVSALENQIRNGDDFVAGLSSLSRVYHANGLYDEAISCYQSLIRVESHNPKWPHRLASIYANYGILHDALPLLQRTVDLSPDYAPAWTRLGNSYLKLNRETDAAYAYQTALEFRPDDPHALFGLARTEASRGNWPAVRELLEKAIDQSSVRLGIDLLVTAYEKTGMNKRALALRGKAKVSSMHNEMPDPWVMELYDDCYDPYQLALAAGAAEIMGELETAIRRLKQAIELAPKNALYPTQLGILYKNTNHPYEAEKYLTAAIEIDPKQSDPWAYLVTLQKELGEQVKAESILESGLQHCPESYDLRMEKGRLLSVRGNHVKANESFLIASRVRFDSAQPLIEVATNYFRLGQIDQGIRMLRKALVAEPDHPLALTTLLYAAIATTNHSLADEVLERVNRQPRVPPEDLKVLIQKYEKAFGKSPKR